MSLTAPKQWTTPYRVVHRTLIVPFASPRRILSSAVHNGGMMQADAIINHQVISDSITHDSSAQEVNWEKDPSRYLGQLAKGLDIKGRCVGLMTAVDLRCLVKRRRAGNGLWVEGFFTVGVSNAVRAGEPTLPSPSKIGTINIILVTNARLSMSAMVCAVGVATESKTATLLDQSIMSSSGKLRATGTGTDVVVIASGQGPYCRYSGTHTKIGELLGRVVNEGVREGLEYSQTWKTDRSRFSS